MARGIRLFSLGCLLVAPSCGSINPEWTTTGFASSTGDGTTTAETEAGTQTGTTETGTSETTGDGDGDDCACAPMTDLIFVLSDDDELWSYDPVTNAFAFIAAIPCGGGDYPYSLAVDHDGLAWIMYGGSNDIRVISVHEPELGCTDPGFSPGQAGFGLFGMAFTSGGPIDLCEDLYALSFSGMGGFTEGAGVGSLGIMDPVSLMLSEIGPIDYDGGELAGTAEGRLFAFAGVDPAKIIEFDKDSGAVLDLEPLTGVAKTNASAFAFHGGDAFLFTEAGASDCQGCLEANCGAAIDACLMDPGCTAEFECAVQQADITDECGGLLPGTVQACMSGVCIDECFPATLNIVSKVTRVDWDESGGNGKAIEVINPAGPIRIVGAANSICAPYNPP